MNLRHTLVLIILFPGVAFAQTPYNLLAPLGSVTQINTFAEYLNIVFQYTIGIAALLAVVMIVVCGIKMMTSEAISSKGEARQCITNAIIGLLIAIGSWLLLNTINPTILESNVDPQNVQPSSLPSTIVSPETQARPKSPGWYFRFRDSSGNERYLSTGPEGAGNAQACQDMRREYARAPGITITEECFEVKTSSLTPSSAVEADESSARERLCGYRGVNTCVCTSGKCPSSTSMTGVWANRGACRDPKVYEKACTSFAGMPTDVISAIKTLASKLPSGCDVVVTGGTEAGHKTHGVGLPVFDLRLGLTCMDKYIVENGLNKSGGDKVGARGVPSFSGNSRWLLDGYWYTDEKSGLPRHWHVCKAGHTPWYCNDPK